MIRPDFYLKAVLTVIALCLLTLTLDSLGLFPRAVASAPAGSPTAGVQYGLIPLNPDGSITVRLANNVMDVNIKQVDGRTLFSNAVPIDIRAVDGSGIFNGAVPVQVR
jgi:hypothetical protein